MSAPSAGWPAPTLVGSLARSGWGELAGRHGSRRSILKALVDLLPHGSAEGKVTAAQVADAAGCCVRTARRALQWLEEIGLISWDRGWLDHGRPRPGWVRIHKTVLVVMIRAARASGVAEDRRRERRDALGRRLTKLRLATQRQKPLSRRADMVSTPSFHREGTGRVPLPVDNHAKEKNMTIIPLFDNGRSPAPVVNENRTDHKPAGRCGTCYLRFDEHVRMNAKVPAQARHEFEQVKR